MLLISTYRVVSRRVSLNSIIISVHFNIFNQQLRWQQKKKNKTRGQWQLFICKRSGIDQQEPPVCQQCDKGAHQQAQTVHRHVVSSERISMRQTSWNTMYSTGAIFLYWETWGKGVAQEVLIGCRVKRTNVLYASTWLSLEDLHCFPGITWASGSH